MTPSAPDPARVRAFVRECLPDSPPAVVERLTRFLCLYSGLPIHAQFVVSERLLARGQLDGIAMRFRTVFGKPLTPAGVAAAVKAAGAALGALREMSDLPR